jgi:Uncharacterised nucleotidyltransferase
VTVPERRLALLLCGTRRARKDHEDEIVALLERIEISRLIQLLDGLRLTSLVGRRLLALSVDLAPRLEAAVRERIERARADGIAHELVSLAVLAGLEQAGIRALGLKGSILARQLYDDPGARTVRDIDILVAAGDLNAAIAAVERMGWRHERRPDRASRLPVLHETLWRDEMPRVELHWRVHWYETQFAADALARARPPAAHQPLALAPADGLAALLLFYARDGFYGLRLAADVAAWWDRRCQDAGDGQVDAIAASYPALAAPLEVAGTLLRRQVGLPVGVAARSSRRRLAAELATPFPDLEPAQILANASLVDLLLAPSGQRRAAVARELRKIPDHMERPLRPRDGVAAYLERSEHGLRVLRRWGIALFDAVGGLSGQLRTPRGFRDGV